MSRAAVWTGVTASQALFSLTVRHTPARGAWMRTEHRRDVKGERGAERRPRSARAGPGARVSARCPCEPARSVDTRGRRRADTSGPWTGARAGPGARVSARCPWSRRAAWTLADGEVGEQTETRVECGHRGGGWARAVSRAGAERPLSPRLCRIKVQTKEGLEQSVSTCTSEEAYALETAGEVHAGVTQNVTF